MLGVIDQCRSAALVQNELDFRPPLPRVHRHHDQARPRRSQHAFEEGEAVVEKKRDPVALAQSLRDQIGRHGLDARIERRIA